MFGLQGRPHGRLRARHIRSCKSSCVLVPVTAHLPAGSVLVRYHITLMKSNRSLLTEHVDSRWPLRLME
jgi:hypothetical protein